MLKTENSRYQECIFTLAGYQYRGQSVGSQFTVHQLPGLDTCFDMGRALISATSLSNIFITHGHIDHAGDLTNHFLRRGGWGLPQATYYVQEQDHELILDVIKAQSRLSRSDFWESVQLKPVNIDSVIPLKRGKNLGVKPFLSTHRIPCLGYAVVSNIMKLKQEFIGLHKDELIKLKGSGVELSAPVEKVEIAYPGDTNLNILHKPGGEFVRKAKVLLLECTFLDDEVGVEHARRTGHVHIDDFINHARDGAFENEVILLTHFSARYTTEYIKEVITAKFADLAIKDKIVCLVP